MADSLTSKQAYAAMYLFLADMYEKGWRDLGGLLGSMSLLGDGEPADRALAEDWEKAVEAGMDPNADIYRRLLPKDEL
jgi:hypothetical protein